MNIAYSLWTKAISCLHGLSIFLNGRLTMLWHASRTSRHLSRYVVKALVLVGVSIGLLPTMLDASVQGQEKKEAVADKAKGRIYVSASLEYTLEGKVEPETHRNLIVAIDPATGKWQKMADMTGTGTSVRVSPDRQTILFNQLQGGIWNCDTGGGNNPGRISDRSGIPIWSGDGNHIVATKQEAKNDRWHDETWRINADGSNPIKLPIPDTDAVEDWSPDGKWFVTCSDRHPPHGRGYQIYIMKTDGSEQRRLTKDGLNVRARFSPDSRKIVYYHSTGKDGSSLWVVDVDGKNAKELINEAGLANPSAFWSPDGKRVAAIMWNWDVDKNGTRFLNFNSADYRIEIMDADGDNRRRLNLDGAKFKFIYDGGDWR